MKRFKEKFGFVFVLAVIFVASMSYAAQEFSTDAISQASKVIAESSLVADGYIYEEGGCDEILEGPAQDELWTTEYVLSFDNNSFIESQIRNWEFANAERMSNGYIGRLPTMRDGIVSAAGSLTINVLDHVANHPIASVACNTATGGLTFMETVDRTARSAQILNPPVYLDRYTSYGAMGEGAYNIKGGRISYYETLSTGGPGPITRTHVDMGKTQFGTYYKETRISTPASNNFERFVMNRYPTGSYWDPMSSTSRSITRTQESYLRTTSHGVTTVTPWAGNTLNWNQSPASWSMRTPITYTPVFMRTPYSQNTFSTLNMQNYNTFRTTTSYSRQRY